jgi:hypothetical protein
MKAYRIVIGVIATALVASAFAGTAGAARATTHFTGVQVLTAIFDRGTPHGGTTLVQVRHAYMTDVEWLQGLMDITGVVSPGGFHGTFDLDVDDVDGGFRGHWHGKWLDAGGFSMETVGHGYGELEGMQLRSRMEGSFSGGVLEGDVFEQARPS